MGNSGNITIYCFFFFKPDIKWPSNITTQSPHTLILQEGKTSYTHLNSFYKNKINFTRKCAQKACSFLVTCMPTPANMHFLSQTAPSGFETEQASIHGSFTRLLLHGLLFRCCVKLSTTLLRCIAQCSFYILMGMHAVRLLQKKKSCIRHGKD